MTDHRTELRRQLVEAAARRQASERVAPRRRHTMLYVAAAAVVFVAAFVGVLVGDDRPAAADTFVVRVDSESLVVEVVGKVDEPGAAAEELEDAGLEVELIDVPSAPWLVGEIVAVSSDSGDPAVEEVDGRVGSFRVDANTPPTLTLLYGRPAKSGETYDATSSVPDCERWSGVVVSTETRSELRAEFGEDLRWQQVSGGGLEQIDGDAVMPNAAVVDVVPTSSNGAIVVVTDGASTAPSGMECG